MAETLQDRLRDMAQYLLDARLAQRAIIPQECHCNLAADAAAKLDEYERAEPQSALILLNAAPVDDQGRICLTAEAAQEIALALKSRCEQEPSEEQVEAVARAFRDETICGCSVNGEHVFCDDPRLSDAVRTHQCECKKGARTAIQALKDGK